MFKPKSLEVFTHPYSTKDFIHDLGAGVLVGIVAIPLSIAIAIASGVTPEQGLITAIIGGFLVSAFGGSRFQIGGPTGAFIVIVYGIIQSHGIEGLLAATFIAGILLVLLGALKLGTIIQYIPHPVVIGFTLGIALIIFSSQVKDMLGLPLTQVPAEFFPKWHLYLNTIGSINYWALITTLSTIGLLLVIQKISRRIPGALIVLVVITLLVQWFQIPIETIGTKFGSISAAIPPPTLPTRLLNLGPDLILPALSIALLAGIESLLSAVIADGMTNTRHDSNTELIAQGLANIVSPLFGGIPVTGAIARTAANIKGKAVSPLAGIIHSLVLVGVLVFLSPLAALIPLAVLSGILAVVAYRMSELHTVRLLLKGPRSERVVLVLTFLLTIGLDLTIAIPLGIVVALVVFVRHTILQVQVHRYTSTVPDVPPDLDPKGITRLTIPDQVDVLDLRGPWFFGAAEIFQQKLQLPSPPPMVRILRITQVPTMDTTGARSFAALIVQARTLGTDLILVGIQPHVEKTLTQLGILEQIGKENLVPDLPHGIQRAQDLMKLHQENPSSN
jgi:SulP family sulfate permease